MTKYNQVSAETVAALEAIVGARNVTQDPDRLHPYSHDEVTEPRFHHMPEAVVFPETTEQVAAIVRLANERLIPVVPRGAGTGLACGAVPIHGGIVVSMERMNRIIRIDADSMFMEVEAGVRTEDVQKAAREAGLFYAGDPCSGDSCFIGGNVATNAGGNKAVKYGTTRNQVYGFELVTPTGEITQLGGRLRKSSTGYALAELVMGSEGTLGIITRITLKLLPIPKHVMDLLLVFPDTEGAIDIVGRLSKAGITPACVEFMGNDAIQSIEVFIQEKLPHSDRGHYTIVQIESDTEEALEDQAAAIDELASANGAFAVLVPDPAKIWRARKAFAEAVRAENLIHSNDDIVVPVDRMPEVIRTIYDICRRYDAVARVVSHAGDGNIHLSILKGSIPDEQWCSRLEEIHHTIFDYVYPLGGRLSGEHGIGFKRKHMMEAYTDPVQLEMMRAVKKALDPNLIMNPGKIFDVK